MKVVVKMVMIQLYKDLYLWNWINSLKLNVHKQAEKLKSRGIKIWRMVLKVVMKVVMNVIMNEEGGDEGWMIDSERLGGFGNRQTD